MSSSLFSTSNQWLLDKKYILKLSILNYHFSAHLDSPINQVTLLAYIFSLPLSILCTELTVKIWKLNDLLSIHLFPSIVSKAFAIKYKLFQWLRRYCMTYFPLYMSNFTLPLFWLQSMHSYLSFLPHSSLFLTPCIFEFMFLCLEKYSSIPL